MAADEPPPASSEALFEGDIPPAGYMQKLGQGVPVVAQRKQIRLGTMRTQVRSLASLSGSVI